MTEQIAAKIIEIFLPHLTENADLNSIKEIDVNLKTAEKFGISSLQIFEYQYIDDKYSLGLILFVYLEEPDELISHKLMNLTNELVWHFVQKDIPVLPSVTPVLLYNGQKDWTPKNIKELYTYAEDMPDFYIHFIDLKRSISAII